MSVKRLGLTSDKNFYKTLVLLAVPIVLQNLITYLVGFADNVMIGKLGDTAVSGVYMGNQLQTSLQVLSAGIEATLLLISSQYWGKRDPGSVKRVVSVGLRVSFILGLIFTSVCAVFPGAMLRIFTDEPDVISVGVEYLSLVCFSFLLFTLTQALIAAMRAVEVAFIGMVVSTVSLVLNVVLNEIFIFGRLGVEPMGVRGAALATLIARAVELSVIAVYVLCVDKKLRLGFRDFFTFDKAIRRSFIRTGLPIMAGQLVWGSNLVANSMILGRISEEVITAAGLANNINNMTYILMNGLSAAVGIIIGKTVGEGKIHRIREYAVTVQWIFVVLGLATGVTVFLIRDPFISLYDISDVSAGYARQFINVLSVTSVGTCYECGCLFGLVKSGGDVGFVFKNDTLFVFGVVIPSAIITCLCGLDAWIVFACLKSDQILKCVVAFFKIRKYNWCKNLTVPAKTRDPGNAVS